MYVKTFRKLRLVEADGSSSELVSSATMTNPTVLNPDEQFTQYQQKQIKNNIGAMIPSISGESDICNASPKTESSSPLRVT